jgi:hypothetical protein
MPFIAIAIAARLPLVPLRSRIIIIRRWRWHRRCLNRHMLNPSLLLRKTDFWPVLRLNVELCYDFGDISTAGYDISLKAKKTA